MRIINGKQEIKTHFSDILCDESRFTLGVPQKLFFPSNIEELRTVVQESLFHQVPLTALGGQTGITGGSTPTEDCYAVAFRDFKALKRVERLAADRCLLFCEPGITLAELAAFLADPESWPYPVPGASEALSGQRWFYPPDPTELSAQLGGSVATNASGARSFFYGPTRAHIVTLTLVLATGDTVTLRRGTAGPGSVNDLPVDGNYTLLTDQGRSFNFREMAYQTKPFKNACGYFSRRGMELIDLFIGSEGTLGLLAEIGVLLQPLPQIIAGLSFFPGQTEAWHFAEFLRTQAHAGRVPILAVEYFDKSALELIQTHAQELTFPAINPLKPYALYWEYKETPEQPFEELWESWEQQLAAHGSSFEHTWSGLAPQERELLKAFRHTVPELINRQIARNKQKYPQLTKISTDTVLPAAAFTATWLQSLCLVAESGLTYVLFGHIGDCHLHLNFLPHNPAELEQAWGIYERLMKLTLLQGGSLSGEHGIGKLKTKYLEEMYGAAAYQEMLSIKKLLDPLGLLNRGTLFP